jgi:tetratricopeptide (TPR) repeat protein
MRRGLCRAWLVVVAGCSFNPGAAQQALVQGDMKLVQRDYRGAIGLYDQAIASDPTLREAFFNRGVAFRRERNFERAIADIDRAIKLGFDGSRVYAERARIKLEQLAAEAAGDKAKLEAAFGPDDPLGILQDLDRAVQLDSMNQDAVALLLHGAVRIMQGQDEQAERDFQRFLLHHPKARPDLEVAAQKWKKDRPVLDLMPIDELGRLPARGMPHRTA